MWVLRAGVTQGVCGWWSWQMDVGWGEDESRVTLRFLVRAAEWWMMPVT